MAAAKKTAGRIALAPAEQVGPEFLGKTPAEESQQLEVVRERQTKLVEQFGDGLPWHPDHYEAAIRGELRRGCEAFLRAGRYLVVARECALHGEWQGMLERLGMEPRQAQRMMEAARRIAALPNASTSTHLLAAAKSESKVIELLSLPEDQFAELAEHGETGDLSLEEVEQMTVRELRAAVREARADLDAKDQRINKLSDDLNKEHEKTVKAQRRWKTATPDEQLTILKQAVNEAEQNVLAALGGEKSGLRGAVRALASHASDNSQDNDAAVFLSDMIGRLLNATRLVRDDEELPLSIPVVNDGTEA
ncbi:DUF3102 domain-containing protein [Xanthomonas campestris pv. trichodesmae]|uniref:DUF3102 domain-containing protein n=2 Tax=Xanthomonas citri TaxID=346 RepID=A0AB33CJY5_XANCI|nr:hypothetical protein [Xanthomonas citri]ASK91072.1 hypothetical protein XcvCFBP7111P_05765 [Xanthomonas citri pv. vignicola]MBV6779256.1 DUF3102 domain-containing protein [Xanthomonas campestris pv. trichodesmae]MBZ3921770.1 hypothetical protein [Xanthomonas campestris pv. trichodesmae]MBZ3926370.1 hypothetical protein [Xanthomonas citri pv. sesbaniae]